MTCSDFHTDIMLSVSERLECRVSCSAQKVLGASVARHDGVFCEIPLFCISSTPMNVRFFIEYIHEYITCSMNHYDCVMVHYTGMLFNESRMVLNALRLRRTKVKYNIFHEIQYQDRVDLHATLNEKMSEYFSRLDLFTCEHICKRIHYLMRPKLSNRKRRHSCSSCARTEGRIPLVMYKYLSAYKQHNEYTDSLADKFFVNK